MPGPRRVRLAIAATLVGALLAAAAPAAHAAPTWLPVKILGTNQATPPVNTVAMTPSGSILLTWISGGSVNAVFRPPGQEFGSTVPLDNTGGITASALALSDSGDGWAAWCTAGQLHVAVRAVNQLFKRNPPALEPCVGDGGPVVVATGPGRTALLAWVANNGTCNVIQTLQLTISGDNYAPPGTPVPVSDCSGNSTSPRAAENGNGAAAIAFLQGGVVKVTSRSGVGSAFTAAGAVSGGGASSPALDVSPSGTVAAVWRAGQIQASTGPAGATLSSGTGISPATGTVGPPALAFDSAGAAIAAWVDNSSGTNQAFTAIKPAGQDFGGPQGVPGGSDALAGDSDGIDLAPDAHGGTMLVFVRAPGVAWGSNRAAGQGFSTARQISPGGAAASQLDVDGDANGNAVAGMGLLSGGTYTFRIAGFDGAPPGFVSLTLPSGALVGQSLTFAAAASDVWSTPGQITTTWAFGDGTGATGGTVTHAYGGRGSFGVTVTATDGVGNAASTGGPVTIAPIPPLPRIDPPSIFWSFDGRKTRFKLTKLLYTGIPNGVKAFARCTGKRCPFKKTKTGTSRRHRLNLMPLVHHKVHFRPGQTLTVQATKKGFVGRVVVVKLRRGKVPSATRLCLPPGAKKPKRCV